MVDARLYRRLRKAGETRKLIEWVAASLTDKGASHACQKALKKHATQQAARITIHDPTTGTIKRVMAKATSARMGVGLVTLRLFLRAYIGLFWAMILVAVISVLKLLHVLSVMARLKEPSSSSDC
eukprot:TRINITY_DN33924_c0_g1_i1.p1 TRINITY_DN33924_c0_g1~~TRINITY_DN33924_c0_g1_i1.p1  ORF type:complete len:125 (+),score=15.42 TRINITY_DN33924_c0_g1_i1:55-429(+)